MTIIFSVAKWFVSPTREWFIPLFLFVQWSCNKLTIVYNLLWKFIILYKKIVRDDWLSKTTRCSEQLGPNTQNLGADLDSFGAKLFWLHMDCLFVHFLVLYFIVNV